MMSNDSLVDEVRQVREALAERFNYDLRAIADYLREQARKNGRILITLPPRKVNDIEALSSEHDSTVCLSSETQPDLT